MIPAEDIKFDFNDILIQPRKLTTIKSRSNVNPFDKNGFLPLFTAPMTSVVNESNFNHFINNRIKVTLPRTSLLTMNDEPLVWSNENLFLSFSLSQFEQIFLENKYVDKWPSTFVLIDVANGHMLDVLSLATKAKEKYPNLTIMAGNIASPDTYHEYSKAKLNGVPVINYARVGIGNGNGCLTTQQTGVGYPMGSLINECGLIKTQFNHNTMIVADGGMKDYSDIIKALALGADQVMVGSLFNKALESASPLYWKGIKLNRIIGTNMYNMGFNIEKEYYGMSTKKAQLLLGNKVLKTSEGVVRSYPVKYTIEQWVQNFEDYLRSAMSYSEAKTLDEFCGRARVNLITQNAYLRYNK